MDGLDKVALFDEPTLIIIPEAVKLSANDYSTLISCRNGLMSVNQQIGDHLLYLLEMTIDGGNIFADILIDARSSISSE